MRYLYMVIVGLSTLLSACHEQVDKVCPSQQEETVVDWKKTLQEKMPLLGHRNWIVVTDMAYPLQTAPGIVTLYAPESFDEVLGFVSDCVARSEHTFAHVYRDTEQLALTEELCPGITPYREALGKIWKEDGQVTAIPHEELIARLDRVSQFYQVVIIKTRLTLPYTSLFFELDCKYWDAEREAELRRLVGKL